MVFLPPQHGKSELVSRRFPAFLLGVNPDLRLIACSHTHDMAVGLNRDVQRIITSPPYEKLFQGTRLTGSPPGGLSQRRPAARWTSSRSAGGAAPALGRRGQFDCGHPADGVIIDDPFGKREDADSPTMRQRVWDWYANDLYTRLSADGWIVLTHTRWHRDDLAGRLLRKMADRAAEHGRSSACRPCARRGRAIRCDRRQPGEALWPEFKSAAELEIIRRAGRQGFRGLVPAGPDRRLSMAEWPAELFGDWIWVPPEKWPGQFDLRVVCLDASKGKSDKQGDYSAIVFMGVGKDKLLYVDAHFGPHSSWTRSSARRWSFATRCGPTWWASRPSSSRSCWSTSSAGSAASSTRPLADVPDDVAGRVKAARIRRLSQYVINRELRFKADSPGCRLLVDQLMDFPFAEHDDGPDALEMCTRLPLEAG